MQFIKDNNKKDLIQIYLLYAISIIVRYYAPHVSGNIFFFFLLILFYKSERNYFWLAFIFFLVQSPGGLFSRYDIKSALPILGILGSSKYILYSELFIFLSIIKSFWEKPKNKYFFSTPLLLLFIYMFILFILSFAFDVTIIKFINSIRHILPFALFFCLPRLMKKEEDYLKFFKLIFSFVFVLFLGQIFDLIIGKQLSFFLGQGRLNVSGHFVYGSEIMNPFEEIVRSIYGVNLLLLCFIGAMYFALTKNNNFNKIYLYVIISIIFLSVILCASRGWFISFSFMIVLFIFVSTKSISSFALKLVIPIIFIGIVFVASPKVSIQIENSLLRMQTMAYILEGDMSAGGTLARLTDRGPRVWNKYKESPIVGFGFSDEFNKYEDGHVGHHTILLNGGLIGYLLFVYFWFSYNIKLISRHRGCSINNKYKKGLIAFIIGFLGIFIIHSSSAMIFSYETSLPTALLLSIFFSFSSLIYHNTKSEESKINIKRNN